MTASSHKRLHKTPPIEEALVDRIVTFLRDEPVEAGLNHPAEATLQTYLDTYGSAHVASILSALDNSAIWADLLRLLGRSQHIPLADREQLVRDGLASAHVEVRDAALQAAELWDDSNLATLVRTHREPVPWLAEYAVQIARDLEA